jgi:hypothetical protein
MTSCLIKRFHLKLKYRRIQTTIFKCLDSNKTLITENFSSDWLWFREIWFMQTSQLVKGLKYLKFLIYIILSFIRLIYGSLTYFE